ncbi:MAG: hypothetical protein IKV92_09630 [Akkermansia sp.]|nr:hypothetical protein [Akkermansia sp.]
MRISLIITALLMLTGAATAQLLAPQETDPLRVEAAEYGLPLPPTADEVNALSADVRLQQASAIKRVHLLQQLQFIADGHTMTDGNRMATVYLAMKLDAPQAYIQMLQAEANQVLSTVQYRVLRRAYDRLFEVYRVDALGIRFFAESELASLEELSDMSGEIPLESLFNLVKVDSITTAQAAEDLQEVAQVYMELSRIYAEVTDAEQASAVVPQVLELVKRFGKVYPGLAMAPDSIRSQLSAAYSLKIQPVLPALITQRQRLREENFYGNSRLKVLDYFFD